MIDENKLIKEIRNMVLPLTIPEIDDGTTLAYNEALVDVLNAIEEQPRAGKWIPVEEGLPNYYEPVLVTYLYFPNQKIYDDEIAYLDACGNWDWDTKEEIESAEIMAWMPLPEPYVEGEEKNERL